MADKMAEQTVRNSLIRMRVWLTCATLLLVSTGCAVNPVTGQRELTLVSDAQAIAIGQQQYAPAQQMQGGPYSTDPELSAYVNRVGQRVAAESGVDLPYEFVVLNHSTPNAWALPGGKIAINRGLLSELNTEAELAAGLGHEVAHAAARHGAQRIERGMVSQGLVLGTAVAMGGRQYGAFAVQGAQLAAGLIGQKYSRDAEREADYYGTRFMAKAGYDPAAAVSLQETFVRLSKGRGPQSQSFLEGLFASHPPSQERVGNNRRLVEQLRSEGFSAGEQGRQAYAAAATELREHAPAFQAYAQAQNAYQDNDLETALVEVNRALSIASDEAIFHSLRGAIRYRQDRFDDALTNFNRAIARDDAYFAHFLQRGLTHKQVDQRDSAKQDLAQSVRLMPTGIAYHALGEIAEQEGNSDAAKRYYAQASEDQGAAGTAARLGLARLELSDQPGKYLRASAFQGNDGAVLIRVINQAPLAVRNVILQLEAATPGGVVTRNVQVGQLEAGEERTLRAPSAIQQIRNQLTGVRVYPAAAMPSGL